MTGKATFRRVLSYTTERDLETGRRMFVIDSLGISFEDLGDLKRWAVGFELRHVKRSRRQRLGLVA
jgi:hypothetical protein